MVALLICSVLSNSITDLGIGRPPQTCKAWDRPMHLWLDAGATTYGVLEQYGGSITCTFDGVFDEPRPIQGSGRSFFLEVSPDSVILIPRPGGYLEVSVRYKATTISADRVAGGVYLPVLGRPDDRLPHGTWGMIRSH
jgi:hypothetical protein